MFTQALVELVSDEQAKLDVIWCFYENDPAIVEQRYGTLLQAMQPAIVMNRFRPFGGIDCHSIFGEILSKLLGTSSPAAVQSIVASPLAGWQLIDGAFLDSLPALSSDELLRYFDGAVPTWRHATSSVIPRRQGAEKLTARLAQIAHDNVARSMHLIRAAGGEGKSTLLLQSAADVARTGEWSVLWRTSPTEGISSDQIDNLDPTRRWLIVADDADGIVPGLAASAENLSQTGRTGVHFLLAARDADWRSAQGPRKPWSNWLDHPSDIVLRGITSEDANAVMSAWEFAGPLGLRELAAISDPVERAAAFESAVRDAAVRQDEEAKKNRPQEGSFFGGLLAVRFGQNGLQAHVRTFLQRLEHMHIEHGNCSLFEALLYVAACHGTGIPGIDEQVLADLVGVPREWVQRYVVRPLGEEAAAVHSAGHALTRHSQVAGAILVEAEETFGIDLAEIWARVVRQTVLTGRDIRMSRSWFADVLHAGPHLQKALPRQLPNERRKAIAIAAAKADVNAEPDRLTPLVDLGKTYRNAKEHEPSVQVFRENLATVSTKVDYHETIRGYWFEWSTCEGHRSGAIACALASAWLGGLSLSDHLNPAPITPADVKLGCAGLGASFGRLAQSSHNCPFAKARRAVAFLGRGFGYDPKGKRYFDHYDREADKFNTPHPRNETEATAWLASGVAQAGRDLQDPFLKALANPEQVSFDNLQTSFGPSQVSKQHAPRSSSTLPRRHQSTHDKPLKLKSALDGQVRAGIERVLNEAWKAVPPETAPEDRFKLAKQRALQSISRLSPYYKRQVGAFFETQNWRPLQSRDPLK